MARSSSGAQRGALIALVAVAAVGCLLLGWWQLQRYDSASGTAQNLGYALQWPLFAGFVVYAYRRFVVLEKNVRDGTPLPVATAGPREVPEGLLPPRPTAAPIDEPPDPDLDAYNAHLAALARGDAAAPDTDSASRFEHNDRSST